MKYPYEIKATKEELFETMLEMDKEIERLNNIIEEIQNDMAYLDSLGINQVKPKTIWERIELLKGVNKDES